IDAATGLVAWTPTAAVAQPICLKATGPCQGSASDTYRFTVQVQATPPAPPTAIILMPATTPVATKVIADGSASTGTFPLTFEWSWGDGSPLSYGVNVSHAYAIAGSYAVRLTTYDPVGQAS